MADTNWTSVPDVVKRWRPLTASEEQRAPAIIAMVERALRRRWPDLGTRMDGNADLTETVKDIVTILARPVIETDPDVPLHAKSWQETSGSESLSVTLDGPMSGWFLVFDPWMVDALDTEKDDSDRTAAALPVFAAPDPGDWWDRTFPTIPEGRY